MPLSEAAQKIADEAASEASQQEELNLEGQKAIDDAEQIAAEVAAGIDELSEFLPSHNDNGHRNMFLSPARGINTLDDDTARVFFENPNFYYYVYDDETKGQVMAILCQWCDRNGVPTGGMLGERYEENS